MRGRTVRLRPPRSDDWPAWAALRDESRAFLKPWEPTWPEDALTRPAFRRRLRRQAEDAQAGAAYAFLIFRDGDDALVGGISLNNVRRGVSRSCSVGYWIGGRHARQGYMYDALTTVARHVFDGLCLNRLDAACVPDNDASRGLLEKAGFRHEGYARAYLRIDGVWRDHLLFARLAGDPCPP